MPNKKKASLPTPTTEKSTYSTEALPIINQTSIPGNTSTFQTDSSSKAAVAAAPPLPRVDNGNADALLPSQPESDKAAAPINQLDKGKGRAVEQDHTLLPTSVNTNKEVTSQVNFGSNTAIPLILQSASKRPRDKYDHPSSDDSEITKRSDRSFVDDSDDDDDDLVDLSSIYGSKSKKLKSDEDASSKANSSITSLKGEKESIVGEPTALKPFSAPSKNAQRPVAYTSAAYDEFKALQRNGDSLSGAKPNTAAKNGKMGEDQFQLNSTLSMRDVRPPVPSSSSSPAIDKGKNAGMDSGYLSSLNTSSSSPLPGIKSALPTSLDKKPSISAGTPSATTSTSKYPLSADRIRKLQATERSITSARYRMGTLQREMRKYGSEFLYHLLSLSLEAAEKGGCYLDIVPIFACITKNVQRNIRFLIPNTRDWKHHFPNYWL